MNDDDAVDDAVLDDPVGRSLGGRHAHLARRLGRAATYLTGVATFSSVPTDPGAEDWADLARLLGPGAFADMFSCPAVPPPSWEPVFRLEGRQLIWSGGDRTDRPRTASDTGALALYERLGFKTRKQVTFQGFRTPW